MELVKGHEIRDIDWKGHEFEGHWEHQRQGHGLKGTQNIGTWNWGKRYICPFPADYPSWEMEYLGHLSVRSRYIPHETKH